MVDEDLTFAQALAETISEREWEAHPCTDVADARERVKDPSYSGFFVDLVLPRSSGIEILREALAANPGRPAVLMSGHDVDPSAILDALSLGPVMSSTSRWAPGSWIRPWPCSGSSFPASRGGRGGAGSSC